MEIDKVKIDSYETEYGVAVNGDSIADLQDNKQLKGAVDLIITSPPFPLNTKKKYGNLQGDEYREWFSKLGTIFSDLLNETGSIVIEIGNSWEPNRPVQSTLHLEALLSLVKSEHSNLRLIQEFICYNPSRLPSPAQWVTVNRWRAVDSYTHIWWIAKSDYPKADNSKVLRPYSKSMKKLLETKKFNAGIRPSQHHISEDAFAKNNGGSISHNFFELEQIDEKRDVRLPYSVLAFSNTSSNDPFSRRCKEAGITPHPARMQAGIINFFIDFLTDDGDLVVDPFAGSNTTGYIAEQKRRNWRSFEIDSSYFEQSKLRF